MKSAMSRDYVNLMELSGEGGAAVAGTLVGVRNEERLVRIFDFEVDFPPGPHMCFLRYDDRPGVIGAIGTILGTTGVNIADMRVGRQEKGGEALMCLTVDQPIEADVLRELAEGSEAKDAKVVTLEYAGTATGFVRPNLAQCVLVSRTRGHDVDEVGPLAESPDDDEHEDISVGAAPALTARPPFGVRATPRIRGVFCWSG